MSFFTSLCDLLQKLQRRTSPVPVFFVIALPRPPGGPEAPSYRLRFPCNKPRFRRIPAAPATRAYPMIRPVQMMQKARRAAAAALAAASLAAHGARAEDAAPRFRLFPEAAEAPPAKPPGGRPAPKRFWLAAA